MFKGQLYTYSLARTGIHRGRETGEVLYVDLRNDSQLVFMADITADLRMTDRGLRKAIAGGRFPAPDGRFGRRNYWLMGTYRVWREKLAAGAYALPCTLPNARVPHS